MKLIFILNWFYFCCVNGYLTTTSWNALNLILKSNLNKEIKQEAKDIIYKHHYNWTSKFTYKFVEDKRFRLSKQQIDELKTCASLGLCKSVNNYNGTGNFYLYSTIYMKSELYRGITNIIPMRLLPHRLRVNKKWKTENKELYKNSMAPITRNKFIENKQNSLNLDKSRIKDIITIINELPVNESRIFKYRYDIHTMKKKHTINEVAELSCYSKETIRKKLKSINNKIQNELKIYGMY